MDCRQALRESNRRYRHFSQQPSQANFIAYKKPKTQARKVIRNAKSDSFRQFTSSVNHTTPLSRVWQTINVLINNTIYIPINTLNMNNNIIDNKQEIANAIAQHFYQASRQAVPPNTCLPPPQGGSRTFSPKLCHGRRKFGLQQRVYVGWTPCPEIL